MSGQPSVTGCPDFDYGPGQPNLYRLMCWKQSIVQQHGLDEGFRTYRDRLGLPQERGLVRMRLESQRDFAVRQGVFTETSPAGEAFVHQPPPVMGDGNHRTLHGTARSQYVACVMDVVVQGRSAAVVAGDRMLLDFEGDERSRLDDEIEWDPAVFHAVGDHVWHIAGGAPVALDEAFTLLGAHTDFFGHWMSEYLPKYVAARAVAPVDAVPVLVDAHMPPAHRESLELLFGPSLRLIEVPAFATIEVRRLWVAPTLMYMPLHERRNERFSWDATAASPTLFAPVLAELRARVPAPRRNDARIYLARRGFRHRRLVNAAAIEELAAARGFVMVYPEDLPFAEQVRIVREASHILAPEGSALFLAFFARPGAKLGILTHPFTDVLAEYNTLLGLQGVAVHAVTGPVARAAEHVPHDSDYMIPPERFSAFLSGWLDERGRGVEPSARHT